LDLLSGQRSIQRIAERFSSVVLKSDHFGRLGLFLLGLF